MKWLIPLLFILSRLAFVNPGNVFFDSKEYIERWANPNLLSALTNGHPPLHSGYVAMYWPVYQVLNRFNLPAVLIILMIQVFLSWVTVKYFYRTIKLVWGQKLAIYSSVLLSLVPVFWITSEAVMMESTYLFFWVMSFYFLTKFLKGENGNLFDLLKSGLFWILAFMTHTVVIMWIPLYLVWVWMYGRNKLRNFALGGMGALILASLFNAWLLGISFGTNIGGGLYWLYAAKFGEHAAFDFSLATVLRYFRNWIVPFGYNNSWSLLMLAVLGWVYGLKRNKKLAIAALVWILPTMVTNQWWDSLLYGRHSIIASLALCFLAAQLFNKVGIKIFSGLLLIISLSALSWLRKPMPYLQVAAALNKLPPGGLVIDSHFSRPQTTGEYFGQILYVDEPGWSMDKAIETIDGYIKYNKPIFVTGQALSEPYGLFCGPYLHNLSLSYKNGFILEPLVSKYQIQKVMEVSNVYNLDIYQLSLGQGSYPKINKLIDSRRRIDWMDPVRVLWSYL